MEHEAGLLRAVFWQHSSRTILSAVAFDFSGREVAAEEGEGHFEGDLLAEFENGENRH